MSVTYKSKQLADKIFDIAIKKVEERANKYISELYYPGDIAPLPGNVIGVDFMNKKIESTEFHIKKGSIFPNLFSVCRWKYNYSGVDVTVNRKPNSLAN